MNEKIYPDYPDYGEAVAPPKKKLPKDQQMEKLAAHAAESIEKAKKATTFEDARKNYLATPWSYIDIKKDVFKICLQLCKTAQEARKLNRLASKPRFEKKFGKKAFGVAEKWLELSVQEVATASNLSTAKAAFRGVPPFNVTNSKKCAELRKESFTKLLKFCNDLFDLSYNADTFYKEERDIDLIALYKEKSATLRAIRKY